MKKDLSGFTLIELMIAIALIGILSSIAYPSYIQHLVKARRGIAQAELLSFSNAMEQFYIQNSSNYLDSGSAPNVYPTTVTIDGNDMYTLSVAATASTYTITATPKSGTSQASDGTLTLTNTGARTWASSPHW